MLVMVSLTLAVPAGSLPGRSIERDLPREEPVIPVIHNYHKFSTWDAHESSICLLSAITLSTTTFKTVSSVWLTPVAKSNATASSRDSIATAAPMGASSQSRINNIFVAWNYGEAIILSYCIVTPLMKLVSTRSSLKKRFLIWGRPAPSIPCIRRIIRSRSKLPLQRTISSWLVFSRKPQRLPSWELDH